MNEIEYKEALQAARKDYDDAVNKISIDFALTNNTIKFGDFVTDHTSTIKVEKIGTYCGLGHSTPKCVYYGPCYTTKGVPYKGDKRGAVYQSNVVKVNGEVYNK